MSEIKILEFIGEDENGNNKFIVSIPKEPEYNYMPSEDMIVVAHDYVRIHSSNHIDMLPNKEGKYPFKTKGCINLYESKTSVTIHIKDMIDIVMPFLNKHKYLQPEHIADRTYEKDDEYYIQYDIDKPRYKKGDKYPAYSYMGAVIKFYEEGQLVVNIRRCGEKSWSKLTNEMYQQIKSSLQLCKSKWNLLKDKK